MHYLMTAFETVALVGAVVSLVLAQWIPRERIGRQAKALLTLALILLAVGLALDLTHRIMPQRALLMYKGYAKVLFFPFLLFFLYAHGTYRQMARRSEIQRALEESQRRYRTFIEASTEGIYRVEPTTPILVDLPVQEQIRLFYDEMPIVECNQAFAMMYGHSDPQELVGWTLTQFHGSRDVPENIEFLTQIIRNGYRVHDVESREVDRHGQVKYFLNTVIGFVEDGRLVRAWGTQRDITERRLAQQALVRSETRFRQLVETMHDGLWVQGPDGRILYVNAMLCRILERPESQLLGRQIQDFVTPANRSVVEDLMGRAGEEPPPLAEVFWSTPDSGEAICLTSIRSLSDEPGFFGVITDLSAQKELEAALLHAQKMEAVGRLAGGVAHDFNNQLTVIQGYCDLLMRGDDIDEETRVLISEIQKAAARSGKLTSQLLAFSRKQVLRPSVLNVNEVISDLRDPLMRILGSGVELQTRFDEDPLHARVDRPQLEQALMNLAANARDAMMDGGRCTIRTSLTRITEDDQEAQEHPELPTGPYVLLQVQDDGTGMTEATRQRIFEPFFTTKPAGQGTGLGLSMVYGFVKQSGGDIEVESAPGEGTTFGIWLPRVAIEAHGGTYEPVPRTEPFEMAPLILVAEDEEALRRLVHRTLSGAGYRVLEASEGPQAMALAMDNLDEIDLLLADIVMPGMSGVRLASQLRQRRPDLRVLFLSGFARDALKDQPGLEAHDELLAKPFVPGELLRRVEAVLATT